MNRNEAAVRIAGMGVLAVGLVAFLKFLGNLGGKVK